MRHDARPHGLRRRRQHRRGHCDQHRRDDHTHYDNYDHYADYDRVER
jgi:hypothetical protein